MNVQKEELEARLTKPEIYANAEEFKKAEASYKEVVKKLEIANKDYEEVFEKIRQVRQTGIDKIDISLRNVEYQITKSIKKSAASFANVDSLFASSDIKLTAYLTPESLPDNLKDLPAKLKKVTGPSRCTNPSSRTCRPETGWPNTRRSSASASPSCSCIK